MKEKNVIALPVNELKTALTGLGKIIGRRTTLPVLSSVRVSRNDAGVITLEGTDLDSTVAFTLKEKNEGPTAQLLVPFERLQKAVKQSNGRLELSLNKKDEVTVRTFWRDTPIEEKVHVPYIHDFPAVPRVEGEGVRLDQTFRETLKEAAECSSVDESRIVLNSVYLDVEDKKAHYLVSTNGRILFSANSVQFRLKESLVLPTRKFLTWNGWWTEGDATLAVKPPPNDKEPGWIRITSDQWTFITRAIDGKYPKWKECVPVSEPCTRVIIPTGAINGVLEAIARLPGEDLPYHDITLNVAKNTLILQGRSKGADKPIAVPIVEAQVHGKAVVIALDRFNLVKALRFGLTQINLIDELSPLVFSNGGKRMIVMPLRPDGVGTAPTPQPKPTAPAATSTSSTSTKTKPAETSTATQPVNEERKDMPRQTSVAPVNGEHEQQQESPLKQLIQQIETIKTALKDVLGDLGDALDIIKKAEKEKRLSDKEVEAIREKVRDIQSMSI